MSSGSSVFSASSVTTPAAPLNGVEQSGYVLVSVDAGEVERGAPFIVFERTIRAAVEQGVHYR